jgi:endonuclease YncB( thermonuclease family)
MVRQGWALADRERSTRYVNEEAEAQRAKRGLWQGEFAPPATRRKK